MVTLLTSTCQKMSLLVMMGGRGREGGREGEGEGEGGGQSKKGINYLTFLLVLYSCCLNRVLEGIQRSQFIHLQVLTLFLPQYYKYLFTKT